MLEVADLPCVLQPQTTEGEPPQEDPLPTDAHEAPEHSAEPAEAAEAAEAKPAEELEAKDLEQADEEATLNGIGDLATLRRFLRLWQAREAWNRRLVQELLSWSVGQPASQLPVHEEDFSASLGTPAWARPSGALYRAAAATCSSSHIFARPSSKNKNRDQDKPSTCEMSEESSESEERTMYRPGDWPEETRQFQILQGLWPKYLRFRERGQKGLEEQPLVDWRNPTSPHAVERELSIRLLLAQVGHDFETSDWYGLVCRLLLFLHNNVELFVQVQLPFAKRQFMGLPPSDLWHETSRFLRARSKVFKENAEVEEVQAWVQALRKSTVSLVHAAPKIWQHIFVSEESSKRTRLQEEVKRALTSQGLEHYDSVLTGLLCAYGDRLGHAMPKREDLLTPLAAKERRMICRMLGISSRAQQDDLVLLRMLQKRLQAPVPSADDCELLRQDEVPEVATLRVLFLEYLQWEAFTPAQQAELTDDDFLQWLCPKLNYRSERYQDACRKLLQEGRQLADEPHRVFERRELVALKRYLLEMELPAELDVSEYVYADGEQDPEHRIVLPSFSWDAQEDAQGEAPPFNLESSLDPSSR